MAIATSSIGGLISGLDTNNIIEQLMSIERRPVDVMEQRIVKEKSQLEAYRSVNSLLLAFQTTSASISSSELYDTKNTASSNDSVLNATAGAFAAAGTQTFRVGKLAQTSQFMSAGFTNFNSVPIAASGGGTVSIDSAKGGVKAETLLSQVNGGQGIYQGSIKITDRAGNSDTIDLSTAITLQEVLDKINQSSVVNVTASVNSTNGDGLVLTDTSGGAGTLTVADVGLGTTAVDLGLTIASVGNTLTGANINRLGGGMSLASLRDGLGVNNGVLDTIILDDGVGNNFNVNLSSATTIQNVIDTINAASTTAGSTITAAISASGQGLTLTGGAGTNLTVLDSTAVDAVNSTARDLGILTPAGGGVGVPIVGQDLIASLNSVRVAALSGQEFSNDGINGSRADPTVNLGSLTITGGGGPFTIDLTMLNGTSSLSDIVNQFNTQATGFGVALQMRINSVGNGVEVVNSSGGTTYGIANNIGTTAQDLGLGAASIAAGATSNGGDLDRQYLSRATQLDSLNNGTGVAAGSFRLTNSNGISFDINTSGAKTLGNLTKIINDAGLNVTATINATGDGLLLTDTAGGAQNVIVEELNGGRVAADLGILGAGTGAPGNSLLDGSFERTITVDTNDTLQDAMTKIFDSGARVQTSIINDGSAYNPFRMVIASKDSGQAGDMIVDTTLAVFNFQQTSKGQDSVLLLGQGGNAISPTILTASTNTNTSAVLGLTLEMKKVSSEFVTISVTEDAEGISKAATDMVETYNALLGLVNELDTFDTETSTPGLLFGDTPTRNLIAGINDQFFNTITGNASGFTTLFDIGFSFEQDGTLSLDSSRFADLLRTDFSGVRDLLTVSTDVARSDLNAFATASDGAGGGTLLNNIINGNLDSNDFGVANGYESLLAIPPSGTVIDLQFPSPHKITRLVFQHINSTAMPAEQFALRDFTVEYLNPNTNQFELLRNIVGNKAAQTYVAFREPTLVSQLRIKATGTNAADGKFRMVEVQAFEANGLASKLDTFIDEQTDRVNGYFVQQSDLIQSKIADLNVSIASQNERLQQIEVGLIRKFSAMESALSQLQTQGDFFSQQMDSLNKG